VDVGIFPDPGARLSALFGLSWRALRYDIAVGYDFPQYVPVAGEVSRGANLRLATLEVRGCLAPVAGRVDFGVCLSAEGGFFFAEGVGISAPLSEAYAWAAALAGGRVEWHVLDSLALRLSADGGPSLVRPEFQITGSRAAFVYEPSRFLGKGAVGVILRFR